MDCGWIVVGLRLDTRETQGRQKGDRGRQRETKGRQRETKGILRETEGDKEDTERHGETQRDADRHSKRHRR